MGAMRSTRKPAYHLVPIELMEAVALTHQEGDLKYEPANWKKGDAAFFIDALNHAIDHVMHLKENDGDDFYTDLSHAACNIGMVLWAVKRGIVNKESFINAAEILMK